MGCLWTFFLAILTFVLVAGGTWCAMICEVPLWESVPNGLGYILGKDGAIQWAACLYGFLARTSPSQSAPSSQNIVMPNRGVLITMKKTPRQNKPLE